jgi:hypothetical protein
MAQAVTVRSENAGSIYHLVRGGLRTGRRTIRFKRRFRASLPHLGIRSRSQVVSWQRIAETCYQQDAVLGIGARNARGQAEGTTCGGRSALETSGMKHVNVAVALFVGGWGTLPVSAAIVGGQTLMGIDRDTGTIYRISTADASLVRVGSTGQPLIGSLELAPDDYLYGFTSGDSSHLYRINPETGAATNVGSLGIGFIFEGALAIAPDGIGYGASQGNADNPSLFSINLDTGAATVIGLLDGAPDINGLAWRSDGVLIGLDRKTNSLLEINPSTADTSTLAAITPAIGSVGGMTVLDDVGYFATGGPTSSYAGSNELYSFDLFTGQYTRVGSFAPTIKGKGIAGLAVPEPATLCTVLFGVAVLGGGVRGSTRQRQ